MGVYDKLGVKVIINAAGNHTAKGGSIMRPEVLAAMEEASRSFVQLPDLLEKAGRRVAELAGVEAAYITSGAAAGIAIGVAACMTGKDWAKVYQLPDTTGMKDEVIIQVLQRNYYSLMIRLAGAKLVQVGLVNTTKVWHFESAINERTAAIVHFCSDCPPSCLPIQEVIAVAHKHSVPVIVDAAAEFPPFETLRYYADMGADLTVFSGGKGIRGPQASGLVLGRRDLIHACAMNGSPNHGVGRAMKIGKEEIVGLVTALELFANKQFEQQEIESWERRTAYMVDVLSTLRGVKAYRGFPPPPLTADKVSPRCVPVTYVEWADEVVHKSKEVVQRELAEGDPGIMVGLSMHGIMICPHTLQPGEEQMAVERVKHVLCA